jgi:hypothetical protein
MDEHGAMHTLYGAAKRDEQIAGLLRDWGVHSVGIMARVTTVSAATGATQDHGAILAAAAGKL